MTIDVGEVLAYAVEVAKAAEYSCEDSEMCLHVHQTLLPRIQADEGLRFVYEKIEMPVSQLLARIERTGPTSSGIVE